jgi:hypothetical protein
MKSIFLTVLSAILAISSLSQTKTDTIYIIGPQELLSSKFMSVNPDNNKVRIAFFFDVNWMMHGNRQSSVFLVYRSSQKAGQWEWVIPVVNLERFKSSAKVYTLEEFTAKLADKPFLMDMYHRKSQIMLLYGPKNGKKFELYPVDIGTDLSSEG